jgi:predicted amidohydrolase
MRSILWITLSIAILISIYVSDLGAQEHTGKLKIAVAQTEIETTLKENLAKILRLMEEAGTRGCQFAIFPENALYWPEISTDNATRAEIDAAIKCIAETADKFDLYIIFGTAHKKADNAEFRNAVYLLGPDGSTLISYWKTKDVPQSFDVHGVRCNMVLCSDRTFLEYSDLPCLMQGSKVIIDISGGHGGDDGRPDLRWIRYRPWATRTNAYVIVSNPVHDDTDFMGNSPWGGGSAIVRPDGSLQARRMYEKDVLIVQEIDTAQATRAEAYRRKNHPIFKSFWEKGKRLLEGKSIRYAVEITPYRSSVRDIKIAAAQMACSRRIVDNVGRIRQLIAEAARQGADIVVLPELAVTGYRAEDILAASRSDLDDAVRQIRSEARLRGIYVVVGMPSEISGKRRNCALVIGDDGEVKTRYAQIVSRRGNLFAAGENIGTMWFQLKGVRSIVTIGDDADWIEMADLAASRGMYLHFHISYQADAFADDAIVRKQRNLLMLRYAKYGAVVNAADPSELPNPSSPASGASMIVSREGGHNKPAPPGIEYYLPYQTSVVSSAGGDETMILATRRTAGRNDLDLGRHFRNRDRKSRPQRGWYDWIATGAALVSKPVD